MNGARHSSERWQRLAALAGAMGIALALFLSYAAPGALGGWLAAFFFWSSLPIGALCLAAMMGLIPGVWRAELQAQAGAALLLLPLAALSVIPVLVGLAGLYSWASAPGSEGFRGIYLSPLFFIGRTVIFFAATGAIALLLLLRPRSTAIAAAGLIVFVLLDTTIAVDWLMSLEPDFHSSGFGLYVLSIQATIALAFLILSSLFAGNPGARTEVLGGLLLTALLLWAYLAFMQYVISWSDNLPASVSWYQQRGRGVWSLFEYAIAMLGLAPLLLLLFPPVRCSRTWLIALCFAVLAGKALEAVWLVLPVAAGRPGLTAAATLLAFAGIGALNLAAFPTSMRLRPRISGSWRERAESLP
ncbi:hypothetical protein SAZ10_17500 [Mesorhizobium sp. BAC0120]|uniref:hypothetical protein n=1 Tax=Mesorhizobium sp. BAC0120 TaxID=3090670 RepID=UPI00298CD057|nr:hypothetical protein [Mesorhizobium sp. BAC0120]MDW6023548.1 hypothetical protein [Mesorhizobium sp. BAC0120]